MLIYIYNWNRYITLQIFKSLVKQQQKAQNKMALINAEDYGQLSKMAVSVETKKPGKFFNVSISGKRRGKINAGYYQCTRDFNSEDYIILNQSEVYFLPLYIKKYWVKYTKGKTSDGQVIDLPCAFGWDENSKKPDATCKYEYIVAGYLWDAQNGCIKNHETDFVDAGIKAGDPILIYFRCKGTRCSCAFDLVKKINDIAENLPSLSGGDIAFDKSVVNPRRFLIRATIESKNFEYNIGGRKQNSTVDVYVFEPHKQLPDETVKKLVESSKKNLDDFNEQFDKTESVATKTAQYQKSQETVHTEESAPTASNNAVDEISLDETDSTPADNFNIDI